MTDKNADIEPQTPARLSLRQRIQRGGALFVASFGFRQFLRLGSNLILTRLLAPEAFGLIAAALAINVLLANMSDIGIESSVIRSKNSGNTDFLRTAWTMRLARNTLIYLVIALTAGGVMLAAKFGVTPPESVYADPVLPAIILTTAMQILIHGGVSMNRYIAAREIDAGRLTVMEIGVQILSTAVTLTCAFNGFGVWAIVAGILAGAMLDVLLSYIIFPGPSMKLMFVREHFSEIFHFGKWLIIASFLGFLTHRGDQFVFGWAFDNTSFGFYSVAGTWIFSGKTVFEMLTRQAFFPAYSEIIRERPETIVGAYKKSRVAIDALAVLASFGVFFVAEPMVKLLYTEEFYAVADFMKLMSPVLLVFPYTLLHYVILANGDSKTFTVITVATSFLSIIGTIIVLNYFGPRIGILFFTAVNAMAAPVAIAIASKIMPIDWKVELRILAPTAVLMWLAATGSDFS